RKTFDEVRIPPDNIGNQVDHNFIADFIHDGVGNNVEDEPSHFKSGILARLAHSDPKKNELRRRRIEPTSERVGEAADLKPQLKTGLAPLKKRSAEPDVVGDDYVAKLNAEFAKLLSQKSGLAFSFSMKPKGEVLGAQEEEERLELQKIIELITVILETNSIKAKVILSEYKTPVHHFAVFFIGPKEQDPTRCKEMIAALRQVVSGYSQKMVKSSLNIFLVLANARSVIEEHLSKIGAKKSDMP
ncbi:MAG TPA: hypothetical protein VEK06_03215, partial [Myxococcota bacterium]|nr:hypothetical protein [Myxococcota bacterium]